MKRTYSSRISMFGSWWEHLPMSWGDSDHVVHRSYISWLGYRRVLLDEIRDELRKPKPKKRGRPQGKRVPARVSMAERLERMNAKAKALKNK
jgi:hypothetical protein